jgi:hypothetical protein
MAKPKDEPKDKDKTTETKAPATQEIPGAVGTRPDNSEPGEQIAGQGLAPVVEATPAPKEAVEPLALTKDETKEPAPPTPAVSAASAPEVEGDEEPMTTEDVLDWLEEQGAVLTSAQKPDGLVVITRGGQSLKFPGDEAKALSLTRGQLLGVAPENPAAGDGPLEPRQVRDLEAMGVVAAKKDYPADANGPRRTVIVTKGGDKLTFPGDEMKAARLTDERLTGVSEKGAPRANAKRNLFGRPTK